MSSIRTSTSILNTHSFMQSNSYLLITNLVWISLLRLFSKFKWITAGLARFWSPVDSTLFYCGFAIDVYHSFYGFVMHPVPTPVIKLPKFSSCSFHFEQTIHNTAHYNASKVLGRVSRIDNVTASNHSSSSSFVGAFSVIGSALNLLIYTNTHNPPLPHILGDDHLSAGTAKYHS